MGRWAYRESKKAPLSSYFRSYFFCCLIGNFIGFFACMSVKYYDEEITKAKWLGALTGFSFNISGFVWAIIATDVIKNSALVVITLFVLLSGIFFGFVYHYKGNKKKKGTPVSNINSQDMAFEVETYLRKIELNSIATSAAVSDGKLSASYNLIRKKPSISKEDFLIEMEMYEFL